MSTWTLVYGGEEKALGSGWGITADFERERSNKQKGVFRCRTVEGFDAGGPQFAYRQPMAVKRDGVVWFQGFWDAGRQVIEGERQYVEYMAYDVWWLLERQVFMQRRRQFSGTEGHVPTGTYVYDWVLCPEVYLGELLNSVAALLLQTNGEQIQEVLDWANETFNPTKRGATTGRDDGQDIIQAGTINTQALIPVERASGIACSEAIIRVLRMSPDAIVFVDSTTTPPTLNVRTFAKWNYTTNPPTFIDYTNLPEVTVNITAEQEKSVSLQAKYAEQLAGVAIYYRKINSVDGVNAPQMVIDKFPAGITDYTPEVSRHLIELQGSSIQHVTAAVQVNDDNPPWQLFGSAGDKKAWFLAHDKTLSDPKVDPDTVVVGTVSVVDGSGAAVDLGAFPNELLSDTLPKWTGCQVVHAFVVAEVAFTKFSDAARLVPEVKATARAVRHSIKLTDAVTRIMPPYTAISHSDTGEVIPLGVAEQAYRGMAMLQHALGITFVAGQLRSDIKLGCRLKLVGPNTTFTNIVVQSIRERPHYGETIVNGGPMSALDIDVLIALARSSRWRIQYNMPSGRADGGTGAGSAQVDTGAYAPSENTAHGVGGNKLHAVTFTREV